MCFVLFSGWDDDLYLYSTEELEDAEELWDEVA